MHKDFAEWFRELSIEPDRETIQLRWNGVQELTEGIAISDLVPLMRVFLSGKAEEPFVERMREALTKADPTFRRQGNEAELSVLAGAILANLIADDDAEFAIYSALVVLAASFCGQRTGTYTRGVVAEADRKLQVLSQLLRSDTLPAKQKLPVMKWDVAALAANPALVAPELEKVATYARGLQAHHEAWLRYIVRRVKLMQEELDIAWWVFGGYSTTAASRADRLHKSVAPLVVGAELGQMVQILPGPAAAPSFLSHMLAGIPSGTLVELSDAVLNAAKLSLAWPQLSDGGALEGLLPLTSSLQLLRGGAQEEEWRAWIKRIHNVDPSSRYEPLTLAVQAYTEARAMAAHTIACADTTGV